jgi:TRAP transporter TAXI family solute receptor
MGCAVVGKDLRQKIQKNRALFDVCGGIPPMMTVLKNWIHFVRVQWLLIVASLFVVAAFVLTFQFVEPPPPKHLTLAAGTKGGGYDYFAQKYAKALAKDGVKVEIRETNGSIENLQLLQNPDSGVDVAFTQGGVGWMAGVYQESADESPIRSLAEIYVEPLWIFTRHDAPFAALRELKGKRLAAGLPGSGSRALAIDLLKWSGVTPENSKILELSQDAAFKALKEGEADAVFFVGGTGSPFLRKSASDPAVVLHSFGDAAAYLRRFPFLSTVTLPRSVLDFGLNVPPTDVVLVAPAATLVTREDLHPALVFLLLNAAKQFHGGHSIISNLGDFPSAKNLEFPLHKEAARYFKNGPPLLQRFLPYHLAAFIDRTKILILPLLTLLLPLIKVAYPTYRWSIRRKIWKWYREISQVETDYLRGESDPADLLRQVQELERAVARVQVPDAYASELFTLRQHISMIRQLVLQSGEKKADGSA